MLLQMTRSRVSLRASQPGSPEDSDSDTKSPKSEKTPSRGRQGQHVTSESGDMMDTKA